MAAELVLRAPIAGWVAPLSEVDDPVFAEAMLGDGAAIDPTEATLRAPCDGVVGTIHAARHAVTVKAKGGVEVLLHVGLETVALGGAGFEALVREGDTVAAGDPLIAFDLDRLAQGAKSLITPIVITESGGYAIARRHVGRRIEAGEPLLELVASGAASEPAETTSGAVSRRRVVVALAHGLHARPAARMATAIKALNADVSVAAGERRANVRSAVAVMSLGVAGGDTVELAASGPDADVALAALEALLSETEAADPLAPARVAEASPEAATPGETRGVCAAPGLAIGRAWRWVRGDIAVAEAGRGVAAETAALAAALAAVRQQIDTALAAEGDPTRAALLAAHAVFVQDPELQAEAERRIAAGQSAGFAWKGAVGRFAETLGGLADARMAERVDDLRDLERRVLEALTGEPAPAPEPPPGAVLIAEELAPSQLLAIAPGRLAGLVVGRAGPTSHVAILAAAMGLPTLVGAGPGLAAIEDGATVILDAGGGRLQVAPDARALEAAQHRLAALEAGRAAARAQALEPARLATGEAVAVIANLASVADAQAAVAAGAEGCGLLRTEFLFLDRDAPPSEAEQTATYQAIADALGDRPLVVRLLDIGSDKPARFLPAAPEENPALGLRGVRLALRRPDLLATQLRALLKVRAARLSVMVPMVSRLAELRAIRTALETAAADVGVSVLPPLGVMVETASAAMIADQLAAEAAFLSIGTNDLSQYALAMDRGHPGLADEIDALEPAVLRLVAATCRGAGATPVSVCGALAGDPAAIPILIGLGVGRLSMPAPAIAPAKALIRRLTRDDCEALAQESLGLESASDVRALSLARTQEHG